MIKQLTLDKTATYRVSSKHLKSIKPCTRHQRTYSAKLKKSLQNIYGDKCAICGQKARHPHLHHNDGSGQVDRNGKGGQYASWRRAIKASELERKNYSIMCMQCHLIYHFMSDEILESIIKYRHDHPPITRKD